MRELIEFIRAHGLMAYNIGPRLFIVSREHSAELGGEWMTEEVEPTPRAVRKWLGY